MTNLELAGKLQKESEHFSGAQDLVGMLWDAGAALRNLHTENTALRVTEDNLRQALQECQDQRRAAFRRIEELDAMRAQLGQGDPVGTAISYYTEDGHTKWTFQPTKLGWEMPQDSRANERGARSCFDVYTRPAPQQNGEEA